MDNEQVARQIFQYVFHVMGKDAVDEAISGIGRIDDQKIGIGLFSILTNGISGSARDDFFRDVDLAGATETDEFMQLFGFLTKEPFFDKSRLVGGTVVGHGHGHTLLVRFRDHDNLANPHLCGKIIHCLDGGYGLWVLHPVDHYFFEGSAANLRFSQQEQRAFGRSAQASYHRSEIIG